MLESTYSLYAVRKNETSEWNMISLTKFTTNMEHLQKDFFPVPSCTYGTYGKAQAEKDIEAITWPCRSLILFEMILESTYSLYTVGKLIHGNGT